LTPQRPKGHPKQQHYVPRVLLRGFASGTNEQVFAFDKTTSRVFRPGIRNVAVEDRFYDLDTAAGNFTVEPGLAKLEGEIAPILGRIRSEASIGFLSPKERELVALFAMVQHQRTLNFKSKIAQMNVDLAAKLRRLGFDPSQVDGFKEFDAGDIQHMAMRSVANAHEFVPYIISKSWALLQAAPGTTHYISDNPITMQNRKDFGFYGNLGFAVPGIEIYMPISSELAIGWFSESFAEEFSDSLELARKTKMLRPLDALRLNALTAGIRRLLDAFRTGDPLIAEPANTINLNSLQVYNAERFIFARADDFDLARLMIERNPEVRNGPRGKIG
jgi:hypothetical protein